MKKTIDGDSTTTLCITFPPLPPSGSSENILFQKVWIFLGQFLLHTRRELDEELEDSPVAWPCFQAPNVCWDVDAAPDGLQRAGAPAALEALLFWFGISVLVRSYLEPTSAIAALSSHPPLQDLSSFSLFAFCRGALTQPIKSIQTSISHHTSLPELVPCFEEVSILSLVKITGYLFKVWLQ